ncbi:MAG: hypothetical protein ABFD83_09715 [Armatimonadota bacterium]
MRCVEVCACLSAYADGELGMCKRAKIWFHIARCNNCTKKLALIRLLQLQTVRALSEPGDAPDLTDLVMSRLSGDVETSRQTDIEAIRPGRKWAGRRVTAAAVMVVLICSMLVVSRSNRSERSPVMITVLPPAKAPVTKAIPKPPASGQQTVAPMKSKPVQFTAALPKPDRLVKRRIGNIISKPLLPKSAYKPESAPPDQVAETKAPTSEWVVVVSVPVKAEPVANADTAEVNTTGHSSDSRKRAYDAVFKEVAESEPAEHNWRIDL